MLVEDADESMVLELEEGADVDKESDLVVDSKGVLAVEELDLAEDKEAEGLLYGDEEELDKVVTTLCIPICQFPRTSFQEAAKKHTLWLILAETSSAMNLP